VGREVGDVGDEVIDGVEVIDRGDDGSTSMDSPPSVTGGTTSTSTVSAISADQEEVWVRLCRELQPGTSLSGGYNRRLEFDGGYSKVLGRQRKQHGSQFALQKLESYTV